MTTPTAQAAVSTAIHYRTVTVDGIEIFYREAGNPQAPTLLLLHGFPTSSHMFRDLIPLLADEYHLVAPDYPGFGYSARPTVIEFNYTFDHLADVMEHFVDALGMKRYSLYMQDFGGPVGFRLAFRRPQQIRALIIQNANAYDAGVSQGVRDVVLRVWKERTPETEARLKQLFELSGDSAAIPGRRARSVTRQSGFLAACAMAHGPAGRQGNPIRPACELRQQRRAL